jgi:membrane-bound lytic murein transglycosylase MltF
VGDIKVTESNIHAGTKYLDRLMTKFFPDAHFSENNRSLFAFASYNAGPGNIARMRKEAAKRGLDPDKWFNNVELVTAEKIGFETTTYSSFQISVWQSSNRKRSLWLCLALTPPSPRGRRRIRAQYLQVLRRL